MFRCKERGSALILALILACVLVLVGGGLLVVATGAAVASKQRAAAASADAIAGTALRATARDLRDALGAVELREAIRETFDDEPGVARNAIEDILRAVTPATMRQQAGGSANSSIDWSISETLPGDPRVYDATYVIRVEALARGSRGRSVMELAGGFILSVGHLPASHYAVINDSLLFGRSEAICGPVRLEGDGVIPRPVVLMRDVETGGDRLSTVEGVRMQARLRTGSPPLDMVDTAAGVDSESIDWSRVRLLVRAEPAEVPPAAGFYFASESAIYVEGDLERMTLATDGDGRQLVSCEHAELGEVTIDIGSGMTRIAGALVPELMSADLCDRIVVHGGIASLGGGVLRPSGVVEQSAEIIGTQSPSIVRSMLIAASSKIRITNHLIIPEEARRRGVALGVVSHRIAGTGQPGFELVLPDDELRLDISLFLKGGEITADCRLAELGSIQTVGSTVPQDLPIIIRYETVAEGGRSGPPGYPRTRDAAVYVGWPFVTEVRVVEDLR